MLSIVVGNTWGEIPEKKSEPSSCHAGFTHRGHPEFRNVPRTGSSPLVGAEQDHVLSAEAQSSSGLLDGVVALWETQTPAMIYLPFNCWQNYSNVCERVWLCFDFFVPPH